MENLNLYPSPSFTPGLHDKSEAKEQKSALDLVGNIFREQLKSMPSAPDNIKMRLGGLLSSDYEHPNDKEIKKNLFDLSTRHLYSTLATRSHPKNLVVMGCVHPDGVGDYYHILNAAEQLKSKFPESKVTMIVSHCADNLSSKVRSPIDKRIETIFYKYTNVPNEIYPVLEQADQIIEISQCVIDPDTRKILQNKGEAYRYIGEYGYTGFAVKCDQPMGLKNNHLGIVLTDKPTTTSLLDLKHDALKTILFGTTNPSKENLENYLQTNEPFVGYIKMGSYYQMGLIYTTAAFLKNSEKHTIDLILPSVKTKYLDMEFLKSQGIGKIKIIKTENDKIIEDEIKLDDKGKELRLIDPFPLEQKDFHTLLAHTNPLVGCTGDHSVSEAFSFDRLPFYEIRYTKVGFHNDLINLAGKVGKAPHYLQQYFQEIANIYDQNQEKVMAIIAAYDNVPASFKDLENYFINKQKEITASSLKIANLMQHPELIEESQMFNELLRTQFSFNSELQNIVERQFALISHADLQKAEKEIQENYLEGRITLQEANEQLSERIKTLTFK